MLSLFNVIRKGESFAGSAPVLFRLIQASFEEKRTYFQLDRKFPSVATELGLHTFQKGIL